MNIPPPNSSVCNMNVTQEIIEEILPGIVAELGTWLAVEKYKIINIYKYMTTQRYKDVVNDKLEKSILRQIASQLTQSGWTAIVSPREYGCVLEIYNPHTNAQPTNLLSRIKSVFAGQ